MGAAEMLPRRRPAGYLRAMILPLGGGASLRPWRTEDAPALAQAANNRNVWISLRDRMPHPYTLADAEDYIRQRLEVDSELMFCIEADGCAVRGIGLHPQKDVCITPSSATGWRKLTRQGDHDRSRPCDGPARFRYPTAGTYWRPLASWRRPAPHSKAACDGM